MRVYSCIVLFLYFGSACAQNFPLIEDTIAPTGKFISTEMISGGFPLVGVSNDKSVFNIKEVLQKPEWVHFNGDDFFFADTVSFADELESDWNIEIELDLPPSEIPPPPPLATNLSKPKYEFGNYLKVFVDTTQIVPIPEYKESVPLVSKTGSTFRERFDAEMAILSRYFHFSNIMVEGYPVMIENVSESKQLIETIEGWIYMIQEAKDKHGEWRPIEFLDYRAVCGNSYGTEFLFPGEYLISKIYKYSGDYRTKLRVRFATYQNVYISNEFDGYINYAQFDRPLRVVELSQKESWDGSEFLRN